ncbi:ArsR family transcriptional regulator, partial [Citrobacter amalonaticus]|nr:ArsR family transcriptional regulator [Citrobacter amalonaticus]
MMDSIKQRIVSYVKANQPVSVADMIRDLSIGRSRYYEEAKALR